MSRLSASLSLSLYIYIYSIVRDRDIERGRYRAYQRLNIGSLYSKCTRALAFSEFIIGTFQNFFFSRKDFSEFLIGAVGIEHISVSV